VVLEILAKSSWRLSCSFEDIENVKIVFKDLGGYDSQKLIGSVKGTLRQR
jgi:hypothetical protein